MKQACRQVYRETLETYRREKTVYNEFARLRRQALKKLTKEETFALRELGL